MRAFDFDDARRVWSALAAKHKATIVNKDSSWQMKTAAAFLGLAGFLDPATFMKRYATTIGTKIYLPFTPGLQVNGSTWSAWKQIVNAPHEIMHVLMYRSGRIEYNWDYAFNTRRRAQIECECMATALEVSSWAGVPCADAYSMAAKLQDYGCSPADISHAEERLQEIEAQVGRFDLSDPAQWKYLRVPSQDTITILSGGSIQ